ncbi:c-type cytochrome [Nitrincola nitratireducens]|uniref:Cytochrome c5 n=1 Tax=Nitrincola nitratireducens TaxID=1229521 RepID=W9UTR5_9GAMM|nr:c-type cytochrome [Nitrincola nitratireducens]EXJ10474.1 Cytochrome c5 [Nitrincola nitratireducens]
MNKFVAKAASALCTLGLGVVLATAVNAAADRDAIIERIKPHGQICVQGDDTCGTPAAAAVAASSSAGRSGADIYNRSCAACHGSGILGAPKFGDGAMTARLNDHGMDGLMANAINGINAMPPKGTCNDCSDDEIQSTIQYMLDND